MHDELYQVDLRDPVRLRSTLDAYLSLKVCPVDAAQRPPLLFPATIEILLPDGSSMTRWGIVIRYTGDSGFLVQFEGPMELGSLEALAAATAAAPAEPAAPAPPEPAVADPSREPVEDPSKLEERSRATVDPDPEPAVADPSREPVEDPSKLEERSRATVDPDPEPEPASPRFGPTVDAFVAGPDPEKPPHEADEVPEAEETSAGISDPFADLVDEAPPGPGTEAATEGGIPEGWSLTGEFDLSSPEQTVSEEPATDVGARDSDTDAPASPVSHNLEDDPPAAVLGNESEMSAIYKQISTLGPSEKQRLARSGNRITRGLLVKDRIKNVHQFVFRNPKITIEEIVEYAKLPGLSKDALRIITSNRTWMASRQVALGLVRNPATPVDLLPGLLQRLGPPQWKILAKSGDVRPRVSSLAKKLLNAAGR